MLSDLDLELESFNKMTPLTRRFGLWCVNKYLTDAMSRSPNDRQTGDDALKALRKLLHDNELSRAWRLLFTDHLSGDGSRLCDLLEVWGFHSELVSVADQLFDIIQGDHAQHLRLVVARACRSMGSVDQARSHLAAVVRARSGMVAEADRAWSYYEIGLIHGDANEDDDALACFARAFRRFKQLGISAGMIAAQNSEARIAFEHGRKKAAENHFRCALSIASEENPAVRERAWCLLDYSRFLTNHERHVEARRHVLEALKLFRHILRHEAGTAWAWYGLSIVLTNLSRRAPARHAAEAALRSFDNLGNRAGSAWAKHLLGRIEISDGNNDKARGLYRMVVSSHAIGGDHRGVIFGLEGLARLAAISGAAEEAAMLYGGSARLRQDKSVPISLPDRTEHEIASAAARARLGGEAYATSWHRGYIMSSEELINLAKNI